MGHIRHLAVFHHQIWHEIKAVAWLCVIPVRLSSIFAHLQCRASRTSQLLLDDINMSGTGVNYQDLLPIPEKTNAISDPEKTEVAQALDEGHTASHALATNIAEHEEKGAAQQSHDEEVKDLGWNEPEEKIPSPLVGGMDNEELWMLVRRFNKVRMNYRFSCSWPIS